MLNILVLQKLAKEKSFLAKALKPNGVLVAYGDDEKTKKIASEQTSRKTLTFGFNDGSDVLASNYNLSYKEKKGMTMPSGISFKVNYEGNSLPIILEGALGRQQAYPALSAISVAIVAKLNIVEAINALRGHITPPGRMRLVEGVKNTLIIDDSYNSSPVAQKEALFTLREIKTANGGRKFAVLGDMRELGLYSTDAHKEIGKEASHSCDILCTVGELGKIISESALDYEMSEKNIYQYETSDEAGKDIQNMIREGDVILVKGSQAVRMEKIVKEIMAEPEKAPDLLVRQEKEWQNR
jgi:UDP-N-acetylmuramoyl-tripeptide--D-alanyl-D-alanine ligase